MFSAVEYGSVALNLPPFADSSAEVFWLKAYIHVAWTLLFV